MKTNKFLLFIFLLIIAGALNAQANEIWSARQQNDQSFVRIRTQDFSHSPEAPGRQVQLCVFNNGDESCHNYPRNLTPSGEYLFARNLQGWSQFFNRCREFDSRNRFILSTQLASIVATGGLGYLAGVTRLVAPAMIVGDTLSPSVEDYPTIPQTVINQAEVMMIYLLMGDGRYRVESLQDIAQFKAAMDLCSTHLNGDIRRNHRRQCLSGCHQMPDDSDTPYYQAQP